MLPSLFIGIFTEIIFSLTRNPIVLANSLSVVVPSDHHFAFCLIQDGIRNSCTLPMEVLLSVIIVEDFSIIGHLDIAMFVFLTQFL